MRCRLRRATTVRRILGAMLGGVTVCSKAVDDLLLLVSRDWKRRQNREGEERLGSSEPTLDCSDFWLYNHCCLQCKCPPREHGISPVTCWTWALELRRCVAVLCMGRSALSCVSSAILLPLIPLSRGAVLNQDVCDATTASTPCDG